MQMDSRGGVMMPRDRYTQLQLPIEGELREGCKGAAEIWWSRWFPVCCMCTAPKRKKNGGVVEILWHNLMSVLFQGPNGEELLTPAVSKVPLGAFEEEEASGTAIDSLDALAALEQASEVPTDVQNVPTPTVALEQASEIPTDIQNAPTPTVVLEQASRSPTDIQATLTPTVVPEQVFTPVSPNWHPL